MLLMLLGVTWLTLFRAHVVRVVWRVATGAWRVPAVAVLVGTYSHQSHKPHVLL